MRNIVLGVGCAVAGVWAVWNTLRRRKEKPGKKTKLDGDTGALTVYTRARPFECHEEIRDERAEAPLHSLLIELGGGCCRIDTWTERGHPSAVLTIQGGMTAFLADTTTKEVQVSRSIGAAIRPNDGEAVLVLVPDCAFEWAPIHAFFHNLGVAVEQGLPSARYGEAVDQFFMLYGIQVPYFIVPISALFVWQVVSMLLFISWFTKVSIKGFHAFLEFVLL